MGRLDEAHIELEKVLAKDAKNEEATRYYSVQGVILYLTPWRYEDLGISGGARYILQFVGYFWRLMEMSQAGFKSVVVDFSIQAASKVIEKNVDSEDNRRIINDAIEGIGKA